MHEPVTYFHLSVCLKILKMINPSDLNDSLVVRFEKTIAKMTCVSCRKEIDRFMPNLKQHIMLVQNLKDQDE